MKKGRKGVHHFQWETVNERGRVAVVVEFDERVIFQSLHGSAPPFNETLIRVVMDDMGWWDWSRDLHESRINQFAIRVSESPFGSMNFDVHVRKSDELGHYPRTARLHKSNRGKLNHGIKMWLGDLYALLSSEEVAWSDEKITVKPVPVPKPDEFDWR